ncbi:hypothetical protein EKO24_013820 [Candidatus Methylobacter oryzae]|uniref:Motility protein n=1 Tax=Candidatus Methylobacter oryzae TaxID=2497749 RepID=A0ABY3C8Q6_9GAMM|nr:hypothetical protein EKO24_013820 [Candidatus Methylobacter oryzae]
MVGSVNGSDAPGLATALMKSATTAQNVDVAIIKKGQDVERAQGEAALKLIDSASGTASSGRVDLYA